MKRLFYRINHILTTDLVDLDLTFINLAVGILAVFWAIVLFLILPICFISSLFN